jgi:hypothetical protein
MIENMIGSCTDIEKPYLRLSGVPDPKFIRPEPVLRLSLVHVMGSRDYAYVSDQLRSIRQDLTVQQIEN